MNLIQAFANALHILPGQNTFQWQLHLATIGNHQFTSQQQVDYPVVHPYIEAVFVPDSLTVERRLVEIFQQHLPARMGGIKNQQCIIAFGCQLLTGFLF